MRLGYLIIAILYLILTIANIDLAKLNFWIYLGIAVVYAGMSGVVDLGVKLD